jgi:hypothetical protein
MRSSLAALMLGAVLMLGAERALGQEQPAEGEGALGGALLGAEVVVFSEALAGVEPLWAYVLGGGLAAAGGAYAGLVIEENSDPDVSDWMVGAGFVLLLPTVVWVGNAREDRTLPEPLMIARSQATPPNFAHAELPARRGLYLPLVAGRF